MVFKNIKVQFKQKKTNKSQMQEKSFCGFFFSYSPGQRRKTRQSKKNLPKHFEKKI